MANLGWGLNVDSENKQDESYDHLQYYAKTCPGVLQWEVQEVET